MAESENTEGSLLSAILCKMILPLTSYSPCYEDCLVINHDNTRSVKFFIICVGKVCYLAESPTSILADFN